MKLFEAVINKEVVLVEGTLNSENFFDSEEVSVIKDGKELTEFGETWSGVKLTATDFLDSLISAYISENQSVEFTFVCKVIEEYKNCIQSYHKYGNSKVPKVVITPSGSRLELVAIAPSGNRYYENQDDMTAVVTHKNGETLTDILPFYEEAMISDWEKDKNFPLIAPYLSEWLSQYEV